MEVLQNFTFVIKHTSGKSNKVDDALSIVSSILQEIKVSSLGFESLINMYKEDVDFKDIYAACENPVTHNISQWLDYMLQEWLLFKNSKLCIPKCKIEHKDLWTNTQLTRKITQFYSKIEEWNNAKMATTVKDFINQKVIR